MNSNERNVIIERHHVVKQTIKSLALNAAKNTIGQHKLHLQN